MECIQKIKRLFDILCNFHLWVRLYDYLELEIDFYTDKNDLQCVHKEVKNDLEMRFQMNSLALYVMKFFIKCFKGNVNYILSKLKQAKVRINCLATSINQTKDLLPFKLLTLKRHLYNISNTYLVYYSKVHHNSPETDREDSSDEEQEKHSSLRSRVTASQRSLEVDETIDEINVDKSITELNSETSEAYKRPVPSCHPNSCQEISSEVQKFFQNFTETSKDCKLFTETKDYESLQLPDLTNILQRNVKRKIEAELNLDSKKQATFKVPDHILFKKPTRTRTSDNISRKSLKELLLASSYNSKAFLSRRVRNKTDNPVIKNLVSGIMDQILHLLIFNTDVEHNILNTMLVRLEKFQSRLKEVIPTELILDNLTTIANALKMLSSAFSKLNDNYDTDTFNTIMHNVLHPQNNMATIVEEHKYSNNPNLAFTRIVRQTVQELSGVLEITKPYLIETVSHLAGKDAHYPESSFINEKEEGKVSDFEKEEGKVSDFEKVEGKGSDFERQKKGPDFEKAEEKDIDIEEVEEDPDFEHRAILMPKINECVRSPHKIKDSCFSVEPTSSDINGASISKDESSKIAITEQYISVIMDPTKVKKDHRFQKRFYKQIRELRENAKKNNNLNTSNRKELDVWPSISSANDTSASSPVSLKCGTWDTAGILRPLKENYPENEKQDQPYLGFPETSNDAEFMNVEESQQTDKDDE